MKPILKLFCSTFFLAAALFTPSLFADSLTLPKLILVEGAQGTQLSGIFNLSSPSDYAILSDTAFEQPTQGYGVYTDLIGPTFTIVPPHSSMPLTFGAYQFSPGTPKFTQVTGTFDFFYTLYSVDPNSPDFDPIADYVSNDQITVENESFVDFQPNAGPPLQAAAPEPGAWALMAVGLLLVAGSARWKLV